MITYKLWLSKNGEHIQNRTYTADLNRWNTRLGLKTGYPQFQWITIIFPTKMVGGYALCSDNPMYNQACVCVYICYMCVYFCQMDSLRFQYPTISNIGYPSHIQFQYPTLDQPIGKFWFSARPELPERNMFTQYGITIHGIENITDGILSWDYNGYHGMLMGNQRILRIQWISSTVAFTGFHVYFPIIKF